MVPLSKRIRANVVELRANDRRIYVRPPGWDRLYLLWTFRNFHHLPRPVLNHRQQQLIQQLCRNAIVSPDGLIARTRIIGVVENMGVVPDRESATIDLRGTATLPDSSTGVYSEIGQMHTRSNKLDGLLPQRSSVRQYEPSEVTAKSGDSAAKRTDAPHTLMWALALAYAALLLPVLIYVGDRRPPHVSLSSAALQTYSPASGSSPAVVQTDTVRQLLSGGKVSQATAPVAPKPWSSKSSPTKDQGPHSETSVLNQVPASNFDASAQGRLQIAEAPGRSFAYPVAPFPSLMGKVTLKALIAADGTVTNVEVISGDPALARAAVRAVQHWQYRTSEVGGHRVEAETNITISFVGEDVVSVSFPAAPPTTRPETSQGRKRRRLSCY
jgi:TonB family protein